MSLEKPRNVNKIGLGTAQFGMKYGITNTKGKTTRSEVKKIINFARQNAVELIDTAAAYGNCESVIGENDLSHFNVVTKLSKIPENEPDIDEWLEKNISKSLNALSLRKLHGVLLHHPLDMINNAKFAQSFVKLRGSEKVKHIGVSVYCTSELEAIMEKFTPDIVQLPFNVIDRRFEKTGWLAQLKQANVEIHARSVFLQGLLLCKQETQLLKFPRSWKLWQRWDNLKKMTGRSAKDLSLSFALESPYISKAIIGFETQKQMQEIFQISQCGLDLDMNKLQSDDIELIDPRFWR